MTQQNLSPLMSGGCQCGAVRFRCASPGKSTICHCRMCQKAFGGFFASLVEVDPAQVTWTRGTPTWFRSSDKVRRGFCAACGTPLAYGAENSLELATGAFDEPSALPPVAQVNHSARLPFFDTLAQLPPDDESAYAAYQRGLFSFQHPDRDTDDWTPPDPEADRMEL